MKIALIDPSGVKKDNFSMALAYLAGMARERGHEVKVTDGEKIRILKRAL